LKCLSVRQPWAWLIIAGHKDIENRTWYTRPSGKIGIHAGLNRTELPGMIALVEREYGIVVPEQELVFGAVIGTADMVECVVESKSRWFEGPYGFVLKNPKRFAKPIPASGKIGFFFLPA
jgi:hypothetical protein